MEAVDLDFLGFAVCTGSLGVLRAGRERRQAEAEEQAGEHQDKSFHFKGSLCTFFACGRVGRILYGSTLLGGV
jgi:hypothetical protein